MFRIIKEPEKPKKEEPKFNEDLAVISRMNQEFAISLDLNETLKTALTTRHPENAYKNQVFE